MSFDVIFVQIAEFSREKRELEEKINRRESELEIHRHELSQVKEFQKKKAQMQKELEEVDRTNIFLRLNESEFRCFFLDQRSNGLERTRAQTNDGQIGTKVF